MEEILRAHDPRSLATSASFWRSRIPKPPTGEKALWRLLYETAARAQKVLSVNVEYGEPENKRAPVCPKGGEIE